jgi:hypothetical protein
MKKYKEIVLKQYPTAYAEYTEDGIRVMVDGEYLAEEYYLPDTFDEDVAWHNAAITCKITQNFNRTHPLRMHLSPDEKKINRISSRKRIKNVSKSKTDVIQDSDSGI